VRIRGAYNYLRFVADGSIGGVGHPGSSAIS
jgi:hypothetical protein